MENNNLINSVLQDLYAIDPSFREHETKLRTLLEQLIASKPQITIDENYKQQLRYDLIEKFEAQTNKNMNKFKIPSYGQVLAGAAFCALLIFGGVYAYKNNNLKHPSLTVLDKGNFGTLAINKTADHAFGALGAVSSTSGSGGGAPADNKVASSTPSAKAPSASLASPTTPQTSAPMASGMGGGSASSKIMIMPPIQNFKYVYKGKKIDLPSQVEVLKKNKGVLLSADMNAFLDKLNFGLLNLNSFPGTKLQSFALSDDQDFGYQVSVDLANDNVSVNQNWQKWPHAMCTKNGCNNLPQLTMSDIPADDVLINLASDFAKEHGFNLSTYGTPEVQNDFRVQNYASVKSYSPETIYVPDTVSVVYPLELNGKPVYDEGGTKQGIWFSIDIRSKKVSGVWNITSQNYDGSNYDGETDWNRINTLAENGGVNQLYYANGFENNIKTTLLELDTPTISYMQYWMPNDAGDTNQILVPALVFAVKDPGNSYRKNVIVPLAKEILDQQNSFGGYGGGIRPMMK